MIFNLSWMYFCILVASATSSSPLQDRNSAIGKRTFEEIQVNGNQYKVLKKLGDGLEGIAYLAQPELSDESFPVVIKHYKDRPDKPHRPQEYFKAEVDALKFLGRLFDSDPTKKLIVSEYIPGRLLGDILEETQDLSEFTALFKLYDKFVQDSFVTKIYQRASTTLVDFDMRPENIIVTPDSDHSVFRHIDFGNSRLIHTIDRDMLTKAKSKARQSALENFKSTMIEILFLKAIQDPLSPESEAISDVFLGLSVQQDILEKYRNRWNNARNEFKRKQTVGIRIPKSHGWRPLMRHYLERFHGAVIKP
jgi:serine/threonine protein kinase